MNRKRVNKLLAEHMVRRKKLVALVLVAIVLSCLSVGALYNSFYKQKGKEIHYDENSDIDYKVFLKENDYFGDYLGKDQQYIASLIDHIETTFNYDLKIDTPISYSYNYYVEAVVEVKDTNSKTLYRKSDVVLPKEVVDNSEELDFNINKTVSLDYNTYNNLVQTFLKKYNLNNTSSTVTLKMYVGIEGDTADELSSELSDNAAISLQIPLTTQTVDINLNYVLSNGQDKVIKFQDTSVINKYILITGIVCFALDVIEIIYTITYSLKTRSLESIYDNKIKSIFRDYGRYISKIHAELNYKQFQIVMVDDFEDLFEVRNSSMSPILYVESNEQYKSAFIVPTASGLVYIYYLSIYQDNDEDDKNVEKYYKFK